MPQLQEWGVIKGENLEVLPNTFQNRSGVKHTNAPFQGLLRLSTMGGSYSTHREHDTSTHSFQTKKPEGTETIWKTLA
jgi:hypothetical protein